MVNVIIVAQLLMKWKNSHKAIENTVSTIRELIDIKNGYEELMYWVFNSELEVFKLNLCTG